MDIEIVQYNLLDWAVRFWWRHQEHQGCSPGCEPQRCFAFQLPFRSRFRREQTTRIFQKLWFLKKVATEWPPARERRRRLRRSRSPSVLRFAKDRRSSASPTSTPPSTTPSSMWPIFPDGKYLPSLASLVSPVSWRVPFSLLIKILVNVALYSSIIILVCKIAVAIKRGAVFHPQKWIRIVLVVPFLWFCGLNIFPLPESLILVTLRARPLSIVRVLSSYEALFN